MATNVPKLPVYTGKTPVIGQVQPEFNINRADKLAYDAQLFGEEGAEGALNTTIEAINTASSEIENNAAAAEESAQKAEAAVASSGYKGEWYAGAPVEAGDIWGNKGSEWRSLTGANVEPVDGDDWRNLNDYGVLPSGRVLKHRRGTNAEILAGVPAIGEIVMNTTQDELVLGNGAKQGGIPIPKKENVNLTLDLADAVANTGLKQGYTLRIKDRGDALFDVVLASTVTPNGYDIVQCTGVATLALSLRIGNGQVHTDAFGANDIDGLQAMNDRLTGAGGMIILDRVITINKTLRLTRNVSMMGAVKQATGIVCDFSSWTGLGLHSVPDLTGIFIEGGSDTDRGAKYGRQFRDFFVQGINNSTLETLGIFMGTADRRLIPDSASSIGFSIRGGHFSNINVSQFDIGYNISEVWSSYFEMCESLACRVNMEITGQSVNNKFSACSFSPALHDSYTSSTDETGCVRILNHSNYGPTESKVGRPEGLTFSQCNMFSANVGFFLEGSLHVTVDQCIIDLHSDHAIRGISTAGLTISKCYIASTGGDSVGATIELTNTGAAGDLDCKIIHNDIRKITVAGNEAQEAFRCNSRRGVLYEGNEHGGYAGQTVCYIDSLRNGVIKNNRFQLGVDDYTAQRCIFVVGGDNLTIDGNISFQGNMILKMSPSKPTNYHIGANYSTAQETMESGSVQLLTGQSSVFVDLKHTNSGLGAPGVTQLVSIVTASHDQPLTDFTVTPNGVNSRRCTFAVSAPAAADTNIYWQSRCQ